jgi:diguanylate cyclase (GGDEF)-like protein
MPNTSTAPPSVFPSTRPTHPAVEPPRRRRHLLRSVDLAARDRLALISRLEMHGHMRDPDLDAVVATLIAGCRVPMAEINLVTPGHQTSVAEVGVDSRASRLPDELSFGAEVVRTARRLCVTDAAAHSVFAQNPFVSAGRVGSYAGEPLLLDGHVIGAVSIFDAVPRDFTADELEVLRAQARLASVVLRLRTSRAWDPLTGLARRTVLLDRTARALARIQGSTERAALVVFDVIGMADINQTHGSTVGDLMLRELGERLSAECGPADSVARVGGDEFAVLLESVDSEAEACARGARLLKAVSLPMTVLDMTIAPKFFFGTSISPTADADTLLASAERSAASLPNSALRVAEAARTQRVNDLHRAIQDGQLVIHYHPVIALETDELVGVEALVRWQHPERGLLPPSDFIPLAEESGLINELGEWVLRTAATQATAWAAQNNPLHVAINVSPRQMSDPLFAVNVDRTLREVGAPPELVILEVTESALMDQPHAAETLRMLRASGIRLAIDDFGTGYSSLSYLRRFPVDAIKIDRSFVAGLGCHPDDDAIVASVVALARGTGRTVVAEGVETAAHVTRLRALGVQQAQGFLWTEPLAVDAFDTWARCFAVSHDVVDVVA